MRLKTLSLSLLLVASCISSVAAEDEKFEILGKYKLKDGSLSKTDVTLATSFGSEMQCAQACSKADCGAFYVQEDGLTCSLVPEDDSEGFKNLDNLDSADFNYFYKKD